MNCWKGKLDSTIAEEGENSQEKGKKKKKNKLLFNSFEK